MSIDKSIAWRWQLWRDRRPARRPAAAPEPLVGPVAQPVWPAWVDAGRPTRRRREPQRSDLPRRPLVHGCGWFDSSSELRGGLEVLEQEWLDLPSAAELGEPLQFL